MNWGGLEVFNITTAVTLLTTIPKFIQSWADSAELLSLSLLSL